MSLTRKEEESTGSNLENDAKAALLEDDQKDQPIQPGTDTKSPLGEVETPEMRRAKENEHNRSLAVEIGFKVQRHDLMPSSGKYYKPDLSIQFRAASLEEIKHYAGMEENDLLDVDAHIQEILKSCVRLSMNGRLFSYKDLTETDKIYMLFSIRDISILKHGRESKLQQEITCSTCNEKHKYEIDNTVFGYYDIPEGVMKWYSEQERCFVISSQSTGTFKIYIPTIGTQQYLASYIRGKEEQKRRGDGGFYDKQFLKYLQFLVPDWKLLDDAGTYIDKLYVEYKAWSYDKFVAVDKLADRINFGVKPNMTVTCKTERCGATISSLIRFRDGYKSILNISDIGTELFGD